MYPMLKTVKWAATLRVVSSRGRMRLSGYPDGMLQPWPDVERETLASFRVFDVHMVRRTSPRTGKDLDFFVIDTRDWVNVVAFTEDEQLIVVRQFRHGTSRFTVEIPGGVVGRDEPPVDAAARELREESGYEARELRFLGTVNPNPAIFTNTCGTVLATGCRRVGDIQPDPGEDIEVLTLSRQEVLDAVRRGEVDHALVLAAFTWLELTDDAPTLFEG